MDNVLLILLVWNGIVFLLYGIDKLKAMANAWRISEKALLLSGLLLGGVGAVCGMQVFRHKTKKPLFQILVPIEAVITCAAAYYYIAF